MQNVKSRTAYSRHFLRAHLQGFKPLTYAQFVQFVLFKI